MFRLILYFPVCLTMGFGSIYIWLRTVNNINYFFRWPLFLPIYFVLWSYRYRLFNNKKPNSFCIAFISIYRRHSLSNVQLNFGSHQMRHHIDKIIINFLVAKLKMNGKLNMSVVLLTCLFWKWCNRLHEGHFFEFCFDLSVAT